MLADYFAEISETKPEDKVLSLACGTGLDAFALAKALGPQGKVLGLDVTDGMLKIANQKVAKLNQQDGPQISFLNADISDLDLLKRLSKGEKWDRITCCSAFVLLQDRLNLLKSWGELLADDGVILVDVLLPNTVLPGEYYSKFPSLSSSKLTLAFLSLFVSTGEILEEIADHFDISIASERLWADSSDSLEALFRVAGFTKIEITTFKYPSPIIVHDIKSQEELDQFWETAINKDMVENFKKKLNDNQLAEAKKMFETKWRAFEAKEFDKDGKFAEEAKVWVVKARK